MLAGHFPPSEQAQHGLSQAASGELDGREGKATTVTMRGLLRGRLEGDRGWKAMLGQVWSLAMLAGHFPPPYHAQHGLPRAGKVQGAIGDFPVWLDLSLFPCLLRALLPVVRSPKRCG